MLSKWCGQTWLYPVYSIGIAMLCVLLWKWNDWDTAQRLVCILSIVLPLHIFEEDTLPGGFPFMNNLAGGSPEPLVYPQNRVTNMFTNLSAVILVSVLVFFAPKLEGPAITFMSLFGIMQFIIHTKLGVQVYRLYKPRGKKTIYGPGYINTCTCLVPLSVMGIKWILEHEYSLADFLYGLLMTFCLGFFFIVIPFLISGKVKSQRYAFRKGDLGYFAKYHED